ncbi:YcaO-like family protein [Streptomyces kaempferi]|uniref:YcaO-like family protein n=1 Tax=Streptomyces kaempferi TaxID=333725 RepID=A0ABW3XS04_9ACTN
MGRLTVPAALQLAVAPPMARPEWSPDLLRATSTGLARGNSRNEALLHALFEVVERDML